MNFIASMKQESRLFFSHKVMAIVISIAILVGLVPFLTGNASQSNYSYRYYNETVEYNGIKIETSNPAYYDLYDIVSWRNAYERGEQAVPDELRAIVLEFIDCKWDFYGKIALAVSDYSDFRYNLSWERWNYVFENFIMEHIDDPAIKALFVDSSRGDTAFYLPGGMVYYDSTGFDNEFVNLTSSARAEKIDSLHKQMELTGRLYSSDLETGFAAYIDMRKASIANNMKSTQESIDSYRLQIATETDPAAIVAMEGYIANLLNSLEYSNKEVTEITYRESMHIIPGDGSWKDAALNDYITGASGLNFNRLITEDEFYNDSWHSRQYESYMAYKAEFEAQRNIYLTHMSRAEKSLETLAPDMRYVTDGIRYKIFSNLSYSSYIFVLAAFVGAWLVANEFQNGTIRLLLIRPKSRPKILASKYLFGLLVCMLSYAIGSLLFFALYGIFHGFGDLSYPLYEISGTVSFASVYLPSFAACMMTFVFAYTLAFFCSTVIRNVAISIVAPIVLYITSIVFNTTLSLMGMDGRGTTLSGILKFTPLPYLNVYQAIHSSIIATTQYGYDRYYTVSYYGGGIMSALSSVSTASLTSCLLVLSISSLVLLAISYARFLSSDISN